MTSIHIEDINTYTNEEIIKLINDLSKVISIREKEKVEKAYNQMENAIKAYFNIYNVSDVCIDDNYYSLDQLLSYLRHNVC